MSWLYQIGVHSLTSPDLVRYEDLYSGAFGMWQNNPDCCGDVDQGPIPPGNWKAVALVDDPETGPDTIVLEPDNNTYVAVLATGRGPMSFRIHGERLPPAVPGYVSKGCIIAPRAVRMALWESPDHDLQVMP